MTLHRQQLDIDHIIPLKLNGKDEQSNFALTFSSANRSKQASDLQLARILHRYEKIRKRLEAEDRSPNLNDLLVQAGGAKYSLAFVQENGRVRYSLAEVGDTTIVDVPYYTDKLSGMEYFFANLAIEYLFHDDIINPRTIGSNINKLTEEFYSGNPQLHVSLAWVDLTGASTSPVKIFDGQHKAAAQILLGVKAIPVRIFINPDRDKLILTNFKAGTTLRQVAFDKSVQRHLGNTLYQDRVVRYQHDYNLAPDDISFSERDLVSYFRGESREMKRYILDAVRDGVTHNPDNRLTEFIDFGGRGKEKPLSYSSIEKTFYSFFVHQDVLETPISYRLEEGKNPRDLEKQQITELMNLIADELFINKFDLELGTNQIENKLQKGEHIALEHLRAYRMSKEEIMYNWLKILQKVLYNFFITTGTMADENKLFQTEFPEQLWINLRNTIHNLSTLPIWVDTGMSATIFGGKQNNQYWEKIFATGSTPQGVRVLSEPINILTIAKE
ncbi:HNH endonuclease [Spirosoma endophyticum]|uniref:HNH endonuclease n=1 Tax=Spirosoma endophyticum TaxID=662367 RepID=A0A1I2GP84_9BACT|nr:HNH endonuclease [Spirosoma endophyticum]